MLRFGDWNKMEKFSKVIFFRKNTIKLVKNKGRIMKEKKQLLLKIFIFYCEKFMWRIKCKTICSPVYIINIFFSEVMFP